ncbi:MAG: hypothetical protein Q4D94_10570 [Bacillota bacterium]|nr:hypothetical protein [Bacillota bacterium]
MTREEIANELFEAGKEVKQCFLNEIALSQANNLSDYTIYPKYIQLLNNLNILYRSLGTEPQSFDCFISEISEIVPGSSVQNTENLFVSKFISVLNGMLINTIKFRQNYCLIRRNDAVPGLASHIITNLGQILTSLNNGYIPIIDTVNADNVFTGLSKLYSVNAWELYFRQPMAANLEAISSGKEVKILDGIPKFMPNYNMDCLMNPDLMAFWRNIMKTYMPLSATLNDRVEHCLNALPFAGSKVLGIICRGTDYTNIRPYNHPVQPSLEAVLAKADEFIRIYQCDYCYLATEDRDILSAFQNKFQDKLLTTQEIYYESDLADTINQTNISNHVDIHQKNMEYSMN